MDDLLLTAQTINHPNVGIDRVQALQVYLLQLQLVQLLAYLRQRFDLYLGA